MSCFPNYNFNHNFFHIFNANLFQKKWKVENKYSARRLKYYTDHLDPKLALALYVLFFQLFAEILQRQSYTTMPTYLVINAGYTTRLEK